MVPQCFGSFSYCRCSALLKQLHWMMLLTTGKMLKILQLVRTFVFKARLTINQSESRMTRDAVESSWLTKTVCKWTISVYWNISKQRLKRFHYVLRAVSEERVCKMLQILSLQLLSHHWLPGFLAKEETTKMACGKWKLAANSGLFCWKSVALIHMSLKLATISKVSLPQGKTSLQ